MPKADSIGWWERCVLRIETHWREAYEVGGTYVGLFGELDGHPITEIAQRGSHHHRPDAYDIYSGDRLLKSIADRSISGVDFAVRPAPPHQTFIPTPSTRSNTPPEGEVWCPHTRQACWGERCALAGYGCAGHQSRLEVVA